MNNRHEPDAPGVLIVGTAPTSLHGGAAARTAQTLRLAVDAAKHDFPHTLREALQRQMTLALSVADLNPEQRVLWARVHQLWRAVAERDVETIRAALHPGYAGWVADEPSPHHRDAAVIRAVEGGPVLHYHLVPMSITVHDGRVGVVHYSFAAAVADEEGTRHVDGRWTEVYAADQDVWLLISMSGWPGRKPWSSSN